MDFKTRVHANLVGPAFAELIWPVTCACHSCGEAMFVLAGAASVGLDLRPTEVLIFGNPVGGTPLMQDQQSIAIDLPMKFAAWENEDGETIVAYNDPMFLAARHGITGNDMILQNMAMLGRNLSAEVA